MPLRLMWSVISISRPGPTSSRSDPAAFVTHEDLGAGRAQRADRHADAVEVAALVHVRATLEDGHRHLAHPPEHGAPAVSRDGRLREAGQVGVVDDGGIRDGVGHRPEPRPEHDAHARAQPGPLGHDRGGLGVAHALGSKSNASGSSSPTVVVMRRPPGRPRWTGVSGAANSASRWRQPPHGGQNSMWAAVTATSMILVWPPATRAPSAEVSAHCPCGIRRVLDVRAHVHLAVHAAERGAHREVRVAHVSGVHHLVGGAEQLLGRLVVRGVRSHDARAGQRRALGAARRLEQEVGVARGDEVLVLDPELRAQPLDLLVLGGEVRARLGHRLELDVGAEARPRRRGGSARPPRSGDGGASRPSRASRTRHRAPRAAAPRRPPARGGSCWCAPRSSPAACSRSARASTRSARPTCGEPPASCSRSFSRPVAPAK